MRFQAIMGVSVAVGLVVMGCVSSPAVKYDPSQHRNWVKAYSQGSSERMVDTLSIEAIRVNVIDTGVRFASFDKNMKRDGIVGPIILYSTLNCKNADIVANQTSWVYATGQMGESYIYPYERERGWVTPEDNSEMGNFLRAMCRQVGVEPKF